MNILDRIKGGKRIGIDAKIKQITVIVSFLFITLSLAILYWQLFPELSQQIAIPLHYNIHSGVDQFGPWWKIFTIPAVALGILTLNLVLAKLFAKKDEILPVFFYAVTLMAQVILFLAMIFVILLNISYYG